MTETVEETIMYFATHAGDNPEKACMPFVMANGAMAMDIKAIVVLQGNGVYLAKEDYRKNMLRGGGFPSIDKLFKDFLELGGELHVCSPCIKERNMNESELPAGSKITAAGQVNLMALKANAIFVY